MSSDLCSRADTHTDFPLKALKGEEIHFVSAASQNNHTFIRADVREVNKYRGVDYVPLISDVVDRKPGLNRKDRG